MGKSNKKAKSERINALRKQYDAFLEEERKRKDRNNYIIGWLDKFQTSSTVSSVRFKESATRSQQIRLLQRPEYEQKNQNLSRLPNIKHPLTENLEETAILNAVSQKYILIPKISLEQYKNHNSVETFSNVKDDADWKSKYYILDVLKQDEKEEEASSQYTDTIAKEDAQLDIPTKDKNVLLTNKHKVCLFDLNSESQQLDETLQKKIINEMPSSEINLKQNNQYKLYEENDLCTNNMITNHNEFDIKYDVIETKALRDCSEKNICSGKSDIQETQKDHDKINLNDNIQKQQESLKELKQDNNIEPLHITKNNCDTIGNDLKLEHVAAQPNISNNVISSEKIPENSTIMEVSQHYNSSSTELSDRKVVTEFNNLPMNHQIGDNIDINKEIKTFEEHPSDISDLGIDSKPQLGIEVTTPQIIDRNVEDQSQIEEFETEQKDLFYSEDQNVNYSYNEEQVAGDIYENNEQYSYYEATKEDPNEYVTTVNEHEESTEQYDPHYQQQFSVNTYEENPIQTQYPTEDYPQNDGVDYQQQQFYENYGQQGTQQQVDESCVYEDNQGNVENLYIQDYGQETISQNEALEHIVESQLNIEDSLPGDDETVVANINEEHSAQEKMNTDMNVT